MSTVSRFALSHFYLLTSVVFAFASAANAQVVLPSVWSTDRIIGDQGEKPESYGSPAPMDRYPNGIGFPNGPRDESRVTVNRLTETSSGTVSMQELQKPLHGDALRMIKSAEKYLRAGKLADAFEVLGKAAKDADARPFAIAILGAEHLKQSVKERQWLDTAIAELEEGARLLPGHAPTHANFGYALMLRGKLEQALEETRVALRLNPSESKTRYVMGRILLNMGRPDEATYHLKVAAADMEAARQLIAQIEVKK